MYDLFVIGNPNKKLREKYPLLKTAESVYSASTKSFTKMFWVIWNDLKINEDFDFSYKVPIWDQDYIHIFKNGNHFDGIALLPKNKSISSRELEYRFFTEKKEIDIQASMPNPYDKFYINSYEDYLEAIEKSTTNMFWCIWDDIKIKDNFKFDYQVPYYNQNIVYVFRNGDYFDGICLFPKNKKVSKKEFDYRFFTEKKEIDIQASMPNPYDKFYINSYDKYLEAIKKSSTSMFWCIWDDVLIEEEFKFDFQVPCYEQHITHVFRNGDYFDGICLFPKNKKVSKKEFDYRFFTEKKEIDIQASVPKPYDKFYINTYEDYLEAIEKSTTNMFWMSSRNLSVENNFNFNLYFSYHNAYDRNQNHAFIHRVNNKDFYNGIFLCSKNKILSKKEVQFRFPTERKEWNVVASGPCQYDKFFIETYEDYLEAVKQSKTEMFWMIPKEIQVENNFNFDLYFTHDNVFDRSIHHSFANMFRGKINYNGIMLISKNKLVSKKEIDFRFLIERKEHTAVVSRLRSYDIFFISYNESNADENYKKLLEKFPKARRVHGIKGIHNAHIEAARLSDTEMFWAVDADAVIVDDFKFDYEVSRYDINCVHIWHSQNPINDLVYGYGGIKLLPKYLTMNMSIDNTDMTTSISKDIKIIPQISNFTIFNTDPFNAWKSAFRECVKLSSRSIQGQIDTETEERLNIWMSIGKDRSYGKYAIMGAISGKKFAELFPENLDKINDFDWLRKKFDEENNL